MPGAPKPWEQPQASALDFSSSDLTSAARPGARPWESQTGTLHSTSALNGGYGPSTSSMYGGGGLYGSNSLYNRPYGGTVR